MSTSPEDTKRWKLSSNQSPTRRESRIAIPRSNSTRGGVAATRWPGAALSPAPGRTYFPNVWDLPGGHVDTDESLGDALARELEEELGIRIDPPVGPPWTTLRTATIELHMFLIDRWEGEPHNLAPDEHDEIRWFAPEVLEGLALADSSYVPLLLQAMGDGG